MVQFDKPLEYRFQQIHIDAARNATDDFNPFHDPYKWKRIRENPFGSTIVLGFQLEGLIEYLVSRYRDQTGEAALLDQEGLRFVNLQFAFVDVVHPDEPLRVDIGKTRNSVRDRGEIHNRATVRKASGLVLRGYVRDSRQPLFPADSGVVPRGELRAIADRSYIGEGQWFLKRKFLSTGHGKNFLAGSLADQHYYFDELEDRVRFPAVFAAALLSGALLEQARSLNYDFETNPVVYTSHRISVDRGLLVKLKSNDALHMLVGNPQSAQVAPGLSGTGWQQSVYRCFGLLEENQILYRAEVTTVPLQQVAAALAARN